MPPEHTDVAREAPDPWAPAIEAATCFPDMQSWLQRLADALELAVRPDVAAVFLCKLGNMSSSTACAASPPQFSELAGHLGEQVVPRLCRAGLESPCDLFEEPENEQVEAITRALREDWLRPAGFQSLVGNFMRSRQGLIAGWVVVFCRTSGRERTREIEIPLGALCAAAESGLRGAFDLAQAVGARFPKISGIPLSDREAEIANLAASGFSDLNIGRRLQISEGTVGRHLNNIYRKLGLSSRLELSELLGVGNEEDLQSSVTGG